MGVSPSASRTRRLLFPTPLAATWPFLAIPLEDCDARGISSSSENIDCSLSRTAMRVEGECREVKTRWELGNKSRNAQLSVVRGVKVIWDLPYTPHGNSRALSSNHTP